MSYGGFGRDGRDSGGTTETMLVESKDVGKIIGRGGSNIKNLELDSKARVKIGREEDENGMKTVDISGSEEEIERAKEIIQDYLTQGNDGGGRRGGGRGGRSGGGGFGRRDDGYGRRDDGYGRRDDGYGRRDRDRDGGDGWGRRDNYGGRGGGGRFGGDDGNKETIFVESSVVGLIIGKGGSNIDKLEKESCCSIKVSKDRTRGGHNSVDLIGSESQIAEAKRLLLAAGVDIMSSDEQEQGRGW